MCHSFDPEGFSSVRLKRWVGPSLIFSNSELPQTTNAHCVSEDTGKNMNESVQVSGNHSCETQNTADFKHAVYPAAYFIIFVLGTAGHLLSMIVFLSQWRKQSFMLVNLLMVNLLLSDLMLVTSLPFRIFYYLHNSSWPFGNVVCRLIIYIFYLNMYSSVYFLVALNILRYTALARPYLYMRVQSGCAGGILCGFIWTLMALASSPLLLSSNERDDGSIRCLELSPQNVDHLLFINNVTLLVGFIVPLVVVIFCSVFVVKSLLTPSPALGRTRPSRKKACALVIISLGIFLLCFLPYHVVRTIFLSAEKQLKMSGSGVSCNYIWAVRKAAVVAHCLCTTNSCLDPILFFFVGENFRKFFAKCSRGRENRRERTLQQEPLQDL